jgi:dihydroxyacid dehydratase/phosphogluconate dehydratase
MGHEKTHISLVTREAIVDGVETVLRAKGHN